MNISFPRQGLDHLGGIHKINPHEGGGGQPKADTCEGGGGQRQMRTSAKCLIFVLNLKKSQLYDTNHKQMIFKNYKF